MSAVPEIPTDEDIRYGLRTLHSLRGEAERIKAELAASRARWEEENADLLKADKSALLTLSNMEYLVRDMAVRRYQVDGSKSPVPGVEVREFSSLAYDEAEAFAWAKEHGIALSLDTRFFEGIAKGAAGNDMGFVTHLTVPKAMVAKDLSKHIANGE